MSWITDNKGQGPWPLAKANRREGGYVNNPRWKNPVTGQVLATSPIWNPDQKRVPVVSGSRHNPCGYWYAGPAPAAPSYPNYDFYVVGWGVDIMTLDTYLTTVLSLGYPGIAAFVLAWLGGAIAAIQAFEVVYNANTWKCLSGRNWNIIAVKSDGTLWGFGTNTDGQLGLGDKIPHLTMTRIGGASDWAFVSVGERDAVAVKDDGSLWVSGENSDGHLGTGATTDLTAFTQIATGYAKAVTCGETELWAIKTDGTIWAVDGSAGLTLTQRDAGPWESIASASAWGIPNAGITKLLIKTDGTLWCYGSNDYGQLGHGDFSPHFEFVQIGSDADWASVAGANTYGIAVKDSGALYAFGGYTSGGDGVYHLTGVTNVPSLLGTGYFSAFNLFTSYGNSGIIDISLLMKLKV